MKHVSLVLKEMICFRFRFLFIAVVSNSCHGMKVNMKGSINLGQEVVETLSQYVGGNQRSGRRQLDIAESDVNRHDEAIKATVKSAFLCEDLDFCKDDLKIFVDTYVIMLAKAVEEVFRDLIADIDKHQTRRTVKAVIFQNDLKQILRHIRKWLTNANENVTDERDVYTYIWIDLLKKVNAKFQEKSIAFASQGLEGNVKDVTVVKRKLIQNLIVITSAVEVQFEHKLCVENNICSPSYECTKALNTLLVQINTASDMRAKEFIRYFSEALPSTNFYYRISDVTAHEFQIILNDMAYEDNISTKTILSAVQNIVEERLKAVASTEVNITGRGEKLIHVILSDMDHFYSKHKAEPFYDFLGVFFEWTKNGGRFNSPLRRVMKDLQNMMSYESDDLVLKLVNEMRVFMEIAVDPER